MTQMISKPKPGDNQDPRLTRRRPELPPMPPLAEQFQLQKVKFAHPWYDDYFMVGDEVEGRYEIYGMKVGESPMTGKLITYESKLLEVIYP